MGEKTFLFNKQKFRFLYFSLFVFIFLIILKIFPSTLAIAAELQWDPSTNATGYKVYYGIESRAYDFMIDVESSLQYPIPDLNYSQLYFFAVTAYNEFGESDFSEEISYQPVINQSPIADAGPDQTVNELTTVTLSGSNSIDPDDGIAEFLWEQLEGTSVNLANPGEEVIMFTAPDVGSTGEALVFSLTVKDFGGLLDSDTCIVNVSDEESDIVEIIEVLYNASKQKLYVKAKSNAPAKSVVLSVWVKFDSKEVELGQLRYDKKMKLYSKTFRKVTSNPINITVKSSGGGIDTQL